MGEDRVPTNLRTLLMIEALAEAREPRTAAELGRLVGLPKQTAHRLCNVLLQQGFFVRDEAGGGLRPGRRSRLMASGVLGATAVHQARHQVLVALAAEVGETVNYVVPEDGGMAYHDRVETDWAFRIQLPVGTTVPFHCTASGKAYMASLPKAERRRLVGAMSLTELTPNTITDPDRLLAELAQIARQGFATDNEEFHLGMIAVAVPIKEPGGRYHASVAFHAPVQRLTFARAVQLAPVVRAAADRLSGVLF